MASTLGKSLYDLVKTISEEFDDDDADEEDVDVIVKNEKMTRRGKPETQYADVGDYDVRSQRTKSNRTSGKQRHRKDKFFSNNSAPLSSSRKEEALAYLMRYENMVRTQEAEDMTTVAHIRPCIERLLELAGYDPRQIKAWSNADNKNFFGQEISFVDLKKALCHLQNTKDTPEFLLTDRQLMMVLSLLTSKTKLTSSSFVNEEEDECLKITWAEFLQCYKVCIAGMQTLEFIPRTATAARARARDRTLSLMSLFEPPSTKLFQEFSSHSNGDNDYPNFEETNRMMSRNGAGSSSRQPSASTWRRRKKTLKRIVLAMLLMGAMHRLARIVQENKNVLVEFFDMITVDIRSAGTNTKGVLAQRSKSSPMFVDSDVIDIPVFDPQPQPRSLSVTKSVLNRTKTTVAPKKTLPTTYSKPSERMKVPTSSELNQYQSISGSLVVIPAVVGGVAGVVGTPMIISGAKIVATALTSTNVLATSMMGVGLVTIATIAAQGIAAIFSRLFVHNRNRYRRSMILEYEE